MGECHCGDAGYVDLATVTEFAPAPGTAWRAGDAWLGGGTWLFSEPEPRRRDCSTWPTSAGRPSPRPTTAWRSPPRARSRSLPAGGRPRRAARWPCAHQPVRAVLRRAARLVQGGQRRHRRRQHLPRPARRPHDRARGGPRRHGARLGPGGTSREVPVTSFVTGERATVLRPGELLRSVFLPAAALAPRAACRQVSLSPAGRSAVLLIGTRIPLRRDHRHPHRRRRASRAGPLHPSPPSERARPVTRRRDLRDFRLPGRRPRQCALAAGDDAARRARGGYRAGGPGQSA